MSYVDPYPTIGEYGGHRFVTRTLNGDYITEDNTFAWTDTDDIFNTHTNIINFDDGVASVLYEVGRLAAYPGLCHVRTKDGSNYTADIQVSETYEYTRGPRLNKYSLSITRVDNEELDGVTLEEWTNTN